MLVRVARRWLIWLSVGRCRRQSMISASPNSSIGRGGPPQPGARGGTQPACVFLTGSVNGPGRVQSPSAGSLLP